jgi:3-hydroxybutyryl-CoA dehydrogenase
MGHGIAFVSAVAGHETVLCDSSAAALESARTRIASLFSRAFEKGKLREDAAAEAGARLNYDENLTRAVFGAFLVVEAVPASLELKQDLFRKCEPLIPSSAVLASNTSALSITEIGSALLRPERFVGMHFFNPVPAMRLVEIVRGHSTNDAVVETMRAFATALGKTAIVVRDSPGFASSRLGVVLGLEAMRMLEQGVATAEDIDRAMELGYNHPMGPLRLTDLVGLDVRLAIAENLHAKLHDDTYRPPKILRDMVAEGKLGRKSGRGFYEWKD